MGIIVGITTIVVVSSVQNIRLRKLPSNNNNNAMSVIMANARLISLRTSRRLLCSCSPRSLNIPIPFYIIVEFKDSMVIQTVEFRERNCPSKSFFRESPYVVLIYQIWDIRRPISYPLDVTTKLGHFPVILRKHLLSSKVTWSQRLQPRACKDYTPPPP